VNDISKVIAHRGASAYAPENTLAALQKAHVMGCCWVEFDVVLSHDATPFLLHDASVKRTTNGKGQVSQLTDEYLAMLDAGSWFSKEYKYEKIPSLANALTFLAEHKMNANIELKPEHGFEQENAVAVLSAINQYWPIERQRPLISSFNHKVLTLVRTIDPDIPMGFLMDKWQDKWLENAKEMRCVSIHCNYKCLTQKRVRELKDAGFIVFAYTVNNKKAAGKLFKWGVDSVFSDYPDILQ
jgi:glycerophosphoryl diester phosphodiesterase